VFITGAIITIILPYNNLVITGLCGIRPSESDTLVLNPLIDNSIELFCLDDVLYHGHKLTVVYDRMVPGTNRKGIDGIGGWKEKPSIQNRR
jgi:hypothetical protein